MLGITLALLRTRKPRFLEDTDLIWQHLMVE
jgi:hypothetical protein